LKGLTKDVKFRKQQLNNLIRFCNENNELLCQALWADLRKHAMECDVGEISPIVDECQYMIKNLDKFVKPTYTSKRFLMNAADKTYIRKEAKGVVLVMGAWNYPVNYSIISQKIYPAHQFIVRLIYFSCLLLVLLQVVIVWSLR
jgi:acyl-CoA reductase-like NAD-dependent aldehyde dehydrogenase